VDLNVLLLSKSMRYHFRLRVSQTIARIVPSVDRFLPMISQITFSGNSPFLQIAEDFEGLGAACRTINAAIGGH
jgi:hypothetical protein